MTGEQELRILDRVEGMIRARISDLVTGKLVDVAECMEELTKEMANVRSDIRLLNFKMFMIGFVTSLVVSGVVSALVAASMRAATSAPVGK